MVFVRQTLLALVTLLALGFSSVDAAAVVGEKRCLPSGEEICETRPQICCL
jgi:hypothetical protein